MRRFVYLAILFIVVTLLTSCNLPARQISSVITEPVLPVTPVPSETSPFAPMMTDTPILAPTETEEPLLTATPGLQPGLQYDPPGEGEPVTITHLEMVDLQIGWGEWVSLEDGKSGSLLRTTDGGQTWQNVTPPSGYPALSRFEALDGRHAWVVPAQFIPGESVKTGTVWRTEDGGSTWLASTPIDLQLQESALLESFLPQALYFLDDLHGWMVVSAGHYMNQDLDVILRTVDGGLTWQQLADKFSMGVGEGQDGGASMPCFVSGIVFVTMQSGYLSGDCLAVGMDEGFSIMATEDGGTTWQEQVLPVPGAMPQAVKAAAAGDQRFCADTGLWNTPAGALVQHTCQVFEGSGMLKNYYFLSLLSEGSLNWLSWAGETASFANRTEGYSLGQLMQDGTRSLSVTTDGGQTWQVVDTVSWPEARLDFLSSSQGYAVAWQWNEKTQANEYAMVYTENGGLRWSLVEGVVK